MKRVLIIVACLMVTAVAGQAYLAIALIKVDQQYHNSQQSVSIPTNDVWSDYWTPYFQTE